MATCGATVSSTSSETSSQTPEQTVERTVGFDCDFLEPPPSIIQTECPICLLIIREPYQLDCCGTKFCHTCIAPLKSSKSPCPTCKSQKFEQFRDLGLKRSLYGLKVYCSSRSEGCDWTGELGQLESHLNTDPLPDKLLEGCQFSVVNCEFNYVGCPVKVLRKYMSEHQKVSLIKHVSLLSSSHAKQQIRIAELVNENEELKTRIGKSAPIPMTTPVFTVNNFEQLKSKDETWLSPPIFTHAGGYKFCLAVIPNGLLDKKGTHLSVLILFMRGEFDGSLKWPFRGTIRMLLMNQLNGKGNHFFDFAYHNSAQDIFCTPPSPPLVCSLRGLRHNFPHSELAPKQLLVNDSIMLRIASVKLDV